MHNVKQTLSLLAALLLVTGCVTGGSGGECLPTDVAIRLTPEQIDDLSDEQVKVILGRNEELAARGCAIPNR